jgi:hypothetical protein
MLEQKVMKGFELALHRKKERILFERRSFSLQSEWEFISKWWHKELATFPSEWEVWKRLLQSVLGFQVCKNVLQVFKFQVLNSKCVKENSLSCGGFQH